MKSCHFNNMDGLRDDHTKRSKSDKDKYHMISLTWGIQEVIQMNLITRQKQPQRHKKQTYGYQRGKGREGRRDKLRVWDQQIHTTKYKTDNPQGPTVQHRDLYSTSCNNL